MNIQTSCIVFKTGVIVVLCLVRLASSLLLGDCGGTFTGDNAELQSPNFPGYYGANRQCIWTITVPEHYKVLLKFHSFELENHPTCDYDYVEILDGLESWRPRLGKFCGDEIPEDILSSGNKMAIKFISDPGTHRSGFSASFSKVPNEDDYFFKTTFPTTSESRIQRHAILYPNLPEIIAVTQALESESTTEETSTNIIGTTSSINDELSLSLQKVTTWILNARHGDWGWGKSTPRAIIALYFSDTKLFTEETVTLQLLQKELELQLAFDLIRNETDPLSLGELSLYLNAFIATCHNPQNIHGLNLVQELRLMTDSALDSNDYLSPSVLLTLCLAGATSHKDIPKLKSILQAVSKPISAGTEAITIMALTCISRNPQFADLNRKLDELVNSSLSKLISSSEKNISENFYSTALVTQALQTNLDSNRFDRTSIMEHLLSHQKADGSFGNLMATYYVSPVLAEKSLLDLSLMHCKDVIEGRGEFSPLSVVREKEHRRIALQYSLWHEKPYKLTVNIQMTVGVGTNFLEVMRLAQFNNDLFRYKSEQLPAGLNVYSIGGVPNDEEQGMRWTLYVRNNVSLPIQPLGSSPLMAFRGDVSNFVPKHGDQVVFWYRH